MSNPLSQETIERMEQLHQAWSTQTILLHNAIGQKVGLTATDMKCLGFLVQHGPQTAGRIASLTGLTTGAVTSLIDRLEEKGAAHRMRDSRDRRKVLVHADKAFAAKLRPLYEHLSKSTGKLYAEYTSGQQKFILDFVERSVQLSERVVEDIRRMKL